MFGMIESLAKAAVAVAVTPATLVADVATMGGLLTDKEKPYTAEALEDALRHLSDATK